jgi:hypothetical protein
MAALHALIISFCLETASGQSNEWTQLSPSGGAPQARYGHTAVVNSANGRMIVFGGVFGTVGAPPLGNDVWVFQDARSNAGSTWQQLIVSGTAPSPRGSQSAVYDQVNNRMIIFGGDPDVGYCFGALNDVWVLTNADGTGGTPGWTQLSPTGTPPSTRSSAGAAYDPVNNRMIVYGGENACDPPAGDVWVLKDANGLGGTPSWTQLSTAGVSPAPRFVHGTVYDSTNNILMIFGGQTASVAFTNDTWILTSANGLGGTPTWMQLNPAGPLPPPRYGFGTAYDPALNSLVVFGGRSQSGGYTNDAWILSNANGLGSAPAWTQLTPGGSLPGGRAEFSCVGVPGTDRIVVCDGFTDSTIYNDVWALQYTPPSPAPAPVLSIAAAGNQSVLYWPASASNYVLQITTNLSSPNWVAVTNGTPIIGVTLTNALPAAYFRLQQP